MEVKIPEPPKTLSKTQISVRQLFGAKRTSSAQARQTSAKPALGEFLLDGPGIDDPLESMHGVDLGPTRVLCSSPRFGCSLQEQLDAIQHTLKVEKFVTDASATTNVVLGVTQPQNESAANQRTAARTTTPRQAEAPRPTAAFRSTARRFEIADPRGPPVGHYMVRYHAVESSSHAPTFPHQRSPRDTVVAAPQVAEVGSEESPVKEESLSARVVARAKLLEVPKLNLKPTSAFASTFTPSLRSTESPRSQLLPHSTAGFTTVNKGDMVYNEAVLSSARTPRQVTIAKTTGRSAPFGARRPQTAGFSSAETYWLYSGFGGPPKGAINFGQQVGRRASAPAKGKRLSTNDPRYEGTSLDYAPPPSWGSSHHVKGAYDFARQTPRRPLSSRLPAHNPPPDAEMPPIPPAPLDAKQHLRGIDFKKMVPVSGLYHPSSSCRAEMYDTNPPELHSAQVDFHRTTSRTGIAPVTEIFRRYSPRASAIAPPAAEPSSDEDSPRIALCHPRIIRNIDISKLPPRRDLIKTAPAPTGADSPSAAAAQKRESKVLGWAPSGKGDPMMSRHLSRQQRNAMLSPKPIATSDRDYDTPHLSLQYELDKNSKNLRFEKACSRDTWRGGRHGYEYVTNTVPGPGAYDPQIECVTRGLA